ncbi:MAG: ImmA/IrrE family metallo-endopeptidase [Chloroflexi bacterium]|nr:ImmA/IrrE family metallo-endopeptidase [Chloroflexota bacterium]
MTLQDVLGDLWLHGIPVVPIDLLPAPSFQGIACIVEGRPVILVSHKYDEPSRIAFLVTHEAGHIAAGHCRADQPVIDEEDDIMDDNQIELIADRYAAHVLVGDHPMPQIEGQNFRNLARNASQLEDETGIDAGMIVFAWASRTGDYARASMAVKALYRASGARRQLSQHFSRYVDMDTTAETDQALLRCVFSEHNAAAD